MALTTGFVQLSAYDDDAPATTGIASVSKDDVTDDGGYALGVAAAARGALWVDRPYFTGRPSVDWLVARADRVTAAGGYCQLGNEANLGLEGWTEGPEEWTAFESQVRALAERPERVLAMPPSPGAAGWQAWVSAGVPQAVHAYGTFEQMRGVVEWYLAATPDELFVTECNFGAGQAVDVDAWANQHLLPFLDWCATEPRVRLAAYFAWRWDQSGSLPTPVDASGTAVETVIRDWRPPMAGGSGLPWDGTVLTVWNLPREPATLLGWCRELAVDAVEIKTADGASSWLPSPARHLNRQYVDALRAGGLRLVLGWSYNYCDLRTGLDATTRTPGTRFGVSLAPIRAQLAWDRGDGVPEREAEAAAVAVRALGLDGHTFDLEVECEGHGDLVAVLFDAARRLMPGTPFAAHTWAYREGHAGYPWPEIGDAAQAVRPMIYRPVWNAAESWTSLGAWYAGKIVCPVWGITESAATVDALAADQAIAEGNDCPGVGFWEYSGLPGQPGVVEWIAALEMGGAAPGPEPEPEPEPPVEPVALAALQTRTFDLCDELQVLADEWSSAGWPSTGVGVAANAEGIKTMVRSSKGEQ